MAPLPFKSQISHAFLKKIKSPLSSPDHAASSASWSFLTLPISPPMVFFGLLSSSSPPSFSPPCLAVMKGGGTSWN